MLAHLFQGVNIFFTQSASSLDSQNLPDTGQCDEQAIIGASDQISFWLLRFEAVRPGNRNRT